MNSPNDRKDIQNGLRRKEMIGTRPPRGLLVAPIENESTTPSLALGVHLILRRFLVPAAEFGASRTRSGAGRRIEGRPLGHVEFLAVLDLAAVPALAPDTQSSNEEHERARQTTDAGQPDGASKVHGTGLGIRN
jgi:hypothetical protein